MQTGFEKQLQSSLEEVIRPIQEKNQHIEERIDRLKSQVDSLPEHFEERIQSIPRQQTPDEETAGEEPEQVQTVPETPPQDVQLEESIKKLAESFEEDPPGDPEDISDKEAGRQEDAWVEQAPAKTEETPAAAVEGREFPDRQSESDQQPSEVGQEVTDQEYISDELEPVFQNETIVIIGGTQNVVPRYEELVESLGGRFEHYLTVDEFSTVSMEDLLDRAYLVVAVGNAALQPGLFRLMAEARRLGRRLYLHHSTAPASLARFLCNLIEKESI